MTVKLRLIVIGGFAKSLVLQSLLIKKKQLVFT